MRNRILCSACMVILAAAWIAATTGTAGAVPVPVNNFSFESPVIPPNSGSGSPPPWIGPVGGNGGAGHFRPGGVLYPNQDGNQLAYLLVRNVPGSFGALFQDVTTIAAGTYSVTVGVAKEGFVPPTTVPFTLNMEAFNGSATNFLAGNNFPVSMFNSISLTDVTTSVTIPAGSPNIGRQLRIVLAVNGQDAGGNPNDPRATYNADNVRLDFVGVPEPMAGALLSAGCLGLSAMIRSRRRR